MNKTALTVCLFIALSLSATGCKNTNEAAEEKETKYVSQSAGNPYLPLWEHLPDGEPRVFEDPDNAGHYRVYIIGSHDLRYDSYCGPDTRMWSAPVEDLSAWRDEGPIFTFQADSLWDVMYAPDLVEVNHPDGTREYYLYPHSRGPQREAMVAKSARPDGPFTPINIDENSRAALPGSIIGFDPSVYVEQITDPNDSDYSIGFRAYAYWGFCHSSAAQLDQNTMYSLRSGTEIIPYFLPAAKKQGELVDPENTSYPCLYPGEDPKAFCFFEASSIRKINNKYVVIYSGHSGNEYGLSSSNSTLRYAYADSPLGPWKNGGVLIDSRAPVLNSDGSEIITSYAGHNTHGSIQQINGQWYVFYHRAPRGFGFARQAMVAPIDVRCDDKSVAQGGKVFITAYNPYPETSCSYAATDKRGYTYQGAEVTSEGFYIFGLNPYQYHPAGIACFLSDNNLQQDAWDIWNNNAPLAGMKSGNIIGYKYFGFGGLKTDTLGLKAFKGTEKGDNAVLNLFLKPLTADSFRIKVFLDGPWKSAPWNGIEIGVISIPQNQPKTVARYSINVADAVEGLQGKHALFLLAEGNGAEPLCDLIGLGFSCDDVDITVPHVPSVSIYADGKKMDLPALPERSTDANGLTDCGNYNITIFVPQKDLENNNFPQIKAEADGNGQVNITVEQADAENKNAVVKCDYNHLIKTYTVHFTPEE